MRRSKRVPCTLPVLLAWTDADGLDRYARGKCRDISSDGLRVETAETIPAQSSVYLRVEKVDVVGSARVRYFRRGGMRNVIGLELSQKVRQQLLDTLRETPSHAPQ
jgi:PilZ domain-containing protein